MKPQKAFHKRIEIRLGCLLSCCIGRKNRNGNNSGQAGLIAIAGVILSAPILGVPQLQFALAPHLLGILALFRIN